MKTDKKTIDAFCTYHHYKEKVIKKTINENGEEKSIETDNPVTKEDFFEKKIEDFVKESVRAHLVNQAVEEARKKVLEENL